VEVWRTFQDNYKTYKYQPPAPLVTCQMKAESYGASASASEQRTVFCERAVVFVEVGQSSNVYVCVSEEDNTYYKCDLMTNKSERRILNCNSK
jgi:hypothetical protein